MRGIYNTSLKIKFSGFIRGVDINKDYFFIGQSGIHESKVFESK